MIGNLTCIQSMEDFELLRTFVEEVRRETSFAVFFQLQPQNSQDAHAQYQTNLFNAARFTLYVMLMLVSLVGNCLLVTAICSKRALLARATNYFILNLAVCDLAILGSCVWVQMINSVNKYWVLGPFFCKLNSYMQMASVVASVLTLAAIACDRYIGVIHPLRTRMRKRYIVCSIVLIWTFALSIALPSYLYREYTERRWADFTEMYCDDVGWPIVLVADETGCAQVTRPAKRLYYTATSVITFFVPMLVMGVTYSIMIAKLRRVRMVGEAAPHEHHNIRKKRKRV